MNYSRPLCFMLIGLALALSAISAGVYAAEPGQLGAPRIPTMVRCVHGLPVLLPYVLEAQKQGALKASALEGAGMNTRLQSTGPSMLSRPFQWETTLTQADARLYAMFSAVDLNMDSYNHPPEEPTDPQPALGATNVPVTTQFGWSCSDPDGDTLRYDVYLGTSAQVQDLVATNIYDTNWTPAAPLAYNTVYYWKIVAKDNEYTTPSSVWNFTTQAEQHPPAEPSSPYPQDGAVGVPTDIQLTWQCSDPDGDALTFDVYFGTTNPPAMVQGDVPEMRYTASGLAANAVYFWQIQAKDGSHSPVPGPVWSFTTTGSNPQPPETPHDPNPPDGSMGIDTTLTIEWQCVDPDGDTLTFNVYFGDVNPPPLVQESVPEARFTVSSTLNFFTTYYWKVEAKDFIHPPVAGPVWSFKTRYDPSLDPSPPHTVITDPVDGKCINEKTYVVSGTVEDTEGSAPSGVKQVEVSFDGGVVWDFATVATQGAQSTTWSYQWNIMSDGDFTILARATDMAENVETQYATVTVKVDAAIPSIWSAGWWDSSVSWETGGPLTMLAIAPDPDIQKIEIYYEGVATGVLLVDDGTQGDWTAGDDIYTLSYADVGAYSIPRGTYFFSLIATDTCGNRSIVWPYLTVFDTGAFMAARAKELPDWTKLMHNAVAKTSRDPARPQVYCGGYYNSYITSSDGGQLTMMSYVSDPDGLSDISQVELYYAGSGTGVYLTDDGSQGDWAAGDGLFMMSMAVGGGIPTGDYLVEIVARDVSGNESLMYPYLTVE